MYLVISLFVLRLGYGIWLYQFLIIADLFTLKHEAPRSINHKATQNDKNNTGTTALERSVAWINVGIYAADCIWLRANEDRILEQIWYIWVTFISVSHSERFFSVQKGICRLIMGGIFNLI